MVDLRNQPRARGDCIGQAGMVASLFLPPRFWSEDDKFLGLRIIDIVSGVSNGIVIPLFNQLYQWVSLKLNEAEGHRYSTQVCGDGMTGCALYRGRFLRS